MNFKAASADVNDLLEGYCVYTEKKMVVAAMLTTLKTPGLFKR